MPRWSRPWPARRPACWPSESGGGARGADPAPRGRRSPQGLPARPARGPGPVRSARARGGPGSQTALPTGAPAQLARGPGLERTPDASPPTVPLELGESPGDRSTSLLAESVGGTAPGHWRGGSWAGQGQGQTLPTPQAFPVGTQHPKGAGHSFPHGLPPTLGLVGLPWELTAWEGIQLLGGSRPASRVTPGLAEFLPVASDAGGATQGAAPPPVPEHPEFWTGPTGSGTVGLHRPAQEEPLQHCHTPGLPRPLSRATHPLHAHPGTVGFLIKNAKDVTVVWPPIFVHKGLGTACEETLRTLGRAGRPCVSL